MKEKILILVKTYPTLSEKYAELVCTAGIREDGTWIRIYPIPFRSLERDSQYKKFQWVEVELEKNPSDPRPESYKLVPHAQILPGEFIPTEKGGWERRKEILFRNTKIYTDLSELIQKSQSNELSLAIYKPKEIIDFKITKENPEWNQEKLRRIQEKIRQPDLFSTEEEKLARETFQVARKLPYKFQYVFLDGNGKKRSIMIEDWEIGQLYWNCRKSDSEEIATQKVKEKYFEILLDRDLYFFLGTTRKFHGWSKNPFLIIGVFYPPRTEPNLFTEIQ